MTQPSPNVVNVASLMHDSDFSNQRPWTGADLPSMDQQQDRGLSLRGQRQQAWSTPIAATQPSASFEPSRPAEWAGSRPECYPPMMAQSPSGIGASVAAPPTSQPQSCSQNHVGSGGTQTEFSIFVGDLSPHVREEDLVASFFNPPMYPSSRPICIAREHAQQAEGDYSPPPGWRPAPFRSTMSAKIMTDPNTGSSRGVGFVRFMLEEDRNRALREMQGVVITPVSGLGAGRPLRVCTAAPKSRNSSSGESSLTRPPSAMDGLRSSAARQPFCTDPTGLSNLGKPQTPGPGLAQNHASRPDPAVYGGQRDGNFAPLTSTGRGIEPYGVGLGFSDQTAAPLLHSRNESTVPNLPTPADLPRSEQAIAKMPSMGGTNSAMDPNNTTVFVGGLSTLITEETLKTFFVPLGKITYVKTPPGKGCGFVQFDRKADAQRAIERMQGFRIAGGCIRLSWSRNQGDKAAAAAANAAAHAAQLGRLANLSGLGGLNAQQLAQLAVLSSVLSAVQQSGAAPVPPSGQTSSPTSELLRHLTALSVAAAQGDRPSPGHVPSATYGAPHTQHAGGAHTSHRSLPLPSGVSSYGQPYRVQPGVAAGNEYPKQRPSQDFSSQTGPRLDIDAAEVQHHLGALLHPLGAGGAHNAHANSQSATELSNRFASLGMSPQHAALPGPSYANDSAERLRSQNSDAARYIPQQGQPQSVTAPQPSQPWNQSSNAPRSDFPAHLRPSEAAETWSTHGLFSPFSPVSSPKPPRDSSSDREGTP